MIPMRNFLLALFFSIPVTFLVISVYLLSPLMWSLLRHASSNADTAGIGAVAGGVSLSLPWLLLIEIVVFTITFATLNRKRKS